MPVKGSEKLDNSMDHASFVATMKRMALQGNKANLARLQQMNPVWFAEEIERIEGLVKEGKKDPAITAKRGRYLSKSDLKRELYMAKVDQKRREGVNK